MKLGIDAPWYDDPVETMAFNLYAMEKEDEEKNQETDEDEDEEY